MTDALELDALWEDFHRVVNMTSQELAAWLRIRDADEDDRAAAGPGGFADRAARPGDPPEAAHRPDRGRPAGDAERRGQGHRRRWTWRTSRARGDGRGHAPSAPADDRRARPAEGLAVSRQERVVRELLGAHGRTYAEEAGIRLKDTPQPLYRLLVLSHLLSARIRGSIALATARALHEAGLRDPRAHGRGRLAGTGGRARPGRLPALRRAYGRPTRRGSRAADRPVGRRPAAAAPVRRTARSPNCASLLQEFPGMGPAGTDIFLREAQGVWPEAAPTWTRKALQGAGRLELPKDSEASRRACREDRPGRPRRRAGTGGGGQGGRRGHTPTRRTDSFPRPALHPSNHPRPRSVRQR